MHFIAIPIDQSILDDKRQFQIQQRPLDQLAIQVDKKEEEEEEESNTELLALSVMSLDSIAQNADFIAF